MRAAMPFAPTPSKRRPMGVSFTTAATTAVTATAKYTGAGIPSQSPPPTLARRAVVVVGIPAVYQSTTPKSSAFVPSVATIGLRRIRPTRNPLTQAGADRGEERDADRRPEPGVVARRVLGEDHDVERQALRRPRGRCPPCMTTSVWPRDAIASADANGSIVRSVPLFEARRGEHDARDEQQRRRSDDRDQSARQDAPRTAPDSVFHVFPTRDLQLRRHVAADTKRLTVRSQVAITSSVIPATTGPDALDSRGFLCMIDPCRAVLAAAPVRLE